MLRYYMTPETRQAVIDESNRLIARRAASNGSPTPRELHDGAERPLRSTLHANANANANADSESEGEGEGEPMSMESAFARLVADLQSASARSRSE